MKYDQVISLRDGRECRLRNATGHDAQAVLDNYLLTHGETDYLLRYPDEASFNVAQEAEFLRAQEESDHQIHLVAMVDGRIAGTAGVNALGSQYKLRHRAEFGISVSREFWGLGIGRALTEVCIACARAAGYLQLELEVVGENARAISMYQRAGFVEFGRNPRGFLSRTAGFQELVAMRLEL